MMPRDRQPIDDGTAESPLLEIIDLAASYPIKRTVAGVLRREPRRAVRAVTMSVLARSGFEPRGDLVFIAQADEEDGTEAVGLTWLTGVRPDIACDFSIDEGGGDRLELADGRTAVTLTVGEKGNIARHSDRPRRGGTRLSARYREERGSPPREAHPEA
jgi:hypothetical protein